MLAVPAWDIQMVLLIKLLTSDSYRWGAFTRQFLMPLKRSNDINCREICACVVATRSCTVWRGLSQETWWAFFLLSLPVVELFYVPGVAPRDFHDGDLVDIKVRESSLPSVLHCHSGLAVVLPHSSIHKFLLYNCCFLHVLIVGRDFVCTDMPLKCHGWGCVTLLTLSPPLQKCLIIRDWSCCFSTLYSLYQALPPLH